MHDPLRLIGLKEELRVRGALQDDQIFGFGRFFVLRPDGWQPGPALVGVEVLDL